VTQSEFQRALRAELYLHYREQMCRVWEAVKPLKFPPRRRRQDREIPKAA